MRNILFLAFTALSVASDVQRRHPQATWVRTPCGSPSGSADIPSKWASQVNSSTTPLPAYPRPQMVRDAGSPSLGWAPDRNTGNPSTWINLNGLWEWEPATSDTPPVGKTLSGAILVPFPVESCLSGVAPNSSAGDHSAARKSLPRFRCLLAVPTALGSY